MIGQLQLFPEPNEDPGRDNRASGRNDYAMGRRDGKSCCVVAEPEWRRGIAAEYGRERTALETERAQARKLLLARVARAEAEVTSARERKAAAHTESLQAESELSRVNALIAALVLRGGHITNVRGDYTAGQKLVEQLQQRLQKAQFEQDRWADAEAAALGNLQECTTFLENWMQSFDSKLQALGLHTAERFRRYDRGYLEMHPHLPCWWS